MTFVMFTTVIKYLIGNLVHLQRESFMKMKENIWYIGKLLVSWKKPYRKRKEKYCDSVSIKWNQYHKLEVFLVEYRSNFLKTEL